MRPVMAGKRNGPLAAMIKLFTRFPQLSYFPARLLGLGFRPEHAPAYARRATERVVRVSTPATPSTATPAISAASHGVSRVANPGIRAVTSVIPP
jgi:hypothetical protein